MAEIKPEVLNTVDMSGETYNTVMAGMRAVAETGTASNIFGNYPIAVGAKTGSAQITATRSDNGVFVAFAPFDDPEIAVAVVVEHGGQGNRVAPIARDIFDAYFGQGEALESVEEKNALRR
jgi:penicillin-binding protein 2